MDAENTIKKYKPIESEIPIDDWINFKKNNIQIKPEHRVDHPDYYNGIPGIECIDVVKHHDFCTGNAIKYLWRAGLKKEEGMSDITKEIEDLEKAIWYINVKIQQLKDDR